MCEGRGGGSNVWSGCIPGTRGKIVAVLGNLLVPCADASGYVSETCAEVTSNEVIC